MPMPMAAPASTPWPGLCVLCRAGTADGLCAGCEGRFAAPRPRCQRCGLGLGLATPACGACLREPPPFARCICVADYGFPWDELVAQMKFRDRPETARLLAPLLVRAVRREDGPLPALVLPVPLAPARLAERGHNQAWELARRCASLLGLPARADLLLRPIDTPHQAGSSREQRQRNLHGAFMVDPRQREALRGLDVAVVDDVMTTGSTAREAAAALLKAGAATVQLWVLARTPDTD